MQESDTYLMILEEGELKYGNKSVLLIGEKRLVPSSEPIKTHLEGITDLERLEFGHLHRDRLAAERRLQHGPSQYAQGRRRAGLVLLQIQ